MTILNRFFPLLARTRLRLGYANDLNFAATRVWELASGVPAKSRRATFDESDVAKITGVFPGSSVPMEMARVVGRELTHGPTIAYELHNVVLVNGHLFTPKINIDLMGCLPPIIVRSQLVEYEDVCLASSMLGLRFFGHWMHDDVPLLMAATDIGTPVSLLKNPTPAQTEYSEILGLNAEVVRQDAFFQRLIVIDDAGQNHYKLDRYLEMRRLASRRVKVVRSEGVIILRGTSGQPRHLVNEVELAAELGARGWTILDPNVHTAAQMIEACTEAPLLLGVEGSHLCNGLMWMSRTGTVVVITPPQRFVTVLKNQCDCLGMNYAFIVADARGDTRFHVNMPALHRLLDRVLINSGHRPAFGQHAK